MLNNLWGDQMQKSVMEQIDDSLGNLGAEDTYMHYIAEKIKTLDQQVNEKKIDSAEFKSFLDLCEKTLLEVIDKEIPRRTPTLQSNNFAVLNNLKQRLIEKEAILQKESDLNRGRKAKATQEQSSPVNPFRVANSSSSAVNRPSEEKSTESTALVKFKAQIKEIADMVKGKKTLQAGFDQLLLVIQRSNTKPEAFLHIEQMLTSFKSKCERELKTAAVPIKSTRDSAVGAVSKWNRPDDTKDKVKLEKAMAGLDRLAIQGALHILESEKASLMSVKRRGVDVALQQVNASIAEMKTELKALDQRNSSPRKYSGMTDAEIVQEFKTVLVIKVENLSINDIDIQSEAEKNGMIKLSEGHYIDKSDPEVVFNITSSEGGVKFSLVCPISSEKQSMAVDKMLEVVAAVDTQEVENNVSVTKNTIAPNVVDVNLKIEEKYNSKGGYTI